MQKQLSPLLGLQLLGWVPFRRQCWLKGLDMTSIIAARAGIGSVNILRTGREVAMPRAIAEAEMVPLGPSPAVLVALCLETRWAVEPQERSWVASLVRWSEGPSTRKTRVTTIWLATVADVGGRRLAA
jgi:hypothetical protein